MTASWSWYVIALVVLNIAGSAWLLWFTGRRRPGDPAPEQTSHYWDGDITEYNKPMPRWWIGLFYLTIIFSIGYLVYFPGFGNFSGTAQWSSQREHDAERAENDRRIEAAFAPFAERPIEQLAGDPVARRLGQSLFANHCAACHGADARGARGFPDLTDAVWHWGGAPADILTTVSDGRQAMMPPLKAAFANDAEIDETVAYVRSLSKQTVDAALAERGAPRFAATCAACHGPDGKGNALMGAPDLTDGYWLYGGDAATVRATVVNGRSGQMPAHGPLLGPARARVVAAWVYGRSREAAAQ
ncbi:MAG TPA: cytochrome-c oxidase, cbb3-type subunit III [Tahibacter sp.]|uniref:cytochrome-c oxidase, cbb3-type subunit III n=1 Tax=Tahibacter sp. TaxID=2056211 RepID=UPI002CED8F44|nr:cytochrome-c oxidase, cbb3-type subunit III [Tahibacter sp.]HSX59464.1 cytochrome-c oxidase, cbb3-type subunit III [Tahibacter sp.]